MSLSHGLIESSAPNHSNELIYRRVISRDRGIPVQDLPTAMAVRGVLYNVVQSVLLRRKIDRSCNPRAAVDLFFRTSPQFSLVEPDLYM